MTARGADGRLAGLAAEASRRYRWALGLAAAALLVLAGASLTVGALPIPVGDVLQAVLRGLGPEAARGPHDALVLSIRIPRTLMAVAIGAALALSGAIMQGLFRNPLADPGLVGVSSGAALAAGFTIVLGDRLLAPALGRMPFAILPFGAFLGGLASTAVLYLIATRRGTTSVALLLLAGIALGALAGSLSGFLAYLSDDRQLRDLTFWSLGSLGGSTWTKFVSILPVVLLLLAVAPRLARGLNGLGMGEAAAYHAGFNVQRIKVMAIVLVALATGASVAVAGMIGFVGIVVPHVVRLGIGADHRHLLPLTALGGGILLLTADLVARTVVTPAELPIGIVTAAIGAPFFLWLLMRREGALGA